MKTTNSEPVRKASPVQQKYLKQRVQALSGRMWRDDETPEPSNVRAARRVVQSWEAAKRKREKAERAVYEKASKEAMEAILFAPPEEALAKVRAYEQLKVKL